MPKAPGIQLNDGAEIGKKTLHDKTVPIRFPTIGCKLNNLYNKYHITT